MVDHPLLLVLALLTLLLWALAVVTVARGVRSIAALRDVQPGSGGHRPSLSIVIAARDEAAAVERAVTSMLRQDYPELEVLVVDDRSTDGTAEILRQLSAREPRLRVLHVDAVPAGWLGKNHALQVGAREATGELILFTDADVELTPGALTRAVDLFEQRALDHLTVAPELSVPGYWGRAFVGFFTLGFSLAIRPWKARDARSRASVGIGAFNLVRGSAYRAIGGHAGVAMRPDDDMKLGKLLKKAGFRQDVAFGTGQVCVAWYPGARAMVQGLEKNLFPTLEYSTGGVLAATLLHLALHVWPWCALLATGGWTWVLNAASAACMIGAWRANQPPSGVPLRHAAAYPLVALLFAYALLRSTVLTLRQGGIRWRGTLYPLAELRANRV